MTCLVAEVKHSLASWPPTSRRLCKGAQNVVLHVLEVCTAQRDERRGKTTQTVGTHNPLARASLYTGVPKRTIQRWSSNARKRDSDAVDEGASRKKRRIDFMTLSEDDIQ